MNNEPASSALPLQSPVAPAVSMVPREIEPGLNAYECPISGGCWIPLQAYFSWRERQPPTFNPAPSDSILLVPDDSSRKALVCPESGRLLLRYGVGQGMNFHLDRSPVTGGVWLDYGEWEALKARGLHASLHLVFTSSYQRQIRSLAYSQQLAATFQERIGEQDFRKVTEFGRWLANHPKSRDICCYLLDVATSGDESPQKNSSR